MAKLALTRTQIITQGLSLGGRPDLTSDARLWLNLFLEEFYMTQDVEWLVKSISGQSVSQGVAMPTDYRSAKSMVIIDSSGSKREIDIINNAADYDRRRIGYESTGSPVVVYANHDEKKFYFAPAPSSGFTYDLNYFYIPTLPDYTDSGTDSQTVKWEMPSHILIDFIKGMAHDYNDDMRYESVQQKITERIIKAKFNNRDSRAGSSRIPMGKRFRRRF